MDRADDQAGATAGEGRLGQKWERCARALPGLRATLFETSFVSDGPGGQASDRSEEQTQAGWPSTRCLNESRGIALGYATEASQVVFEHPRADLGAGGGQDIEDGQPSRFER